MLFRVQTKHNRIIFMVNIFFRLNVHMFFSLSFTAMFSELRNLYWFIRYARNPSVKRRYYRYVAAEKKRLLEAGVDPEELRLMCRALSRRLDLHAEKRLATYRKNQRENQTFF